MILTFFAIAATGAFVAGCGDDEKTASKDAAAPAPASRLGGEMRRFVLVAVVGWLLVVAAPAAAQEYAFEVGGPATAAGVERLELAASSVAIDADGNPWVADLGKDRIVKWAYDGTFVTEFRAIGDVPLVGVTGIATDDFGTVYLALASDPRLVRLDTGGRPLGPLALRMPDGTGVRPRKLAVDASGRLFVSDGSEVVYVFGADGTLVDQISLDRGQAVSDVAVRGDRLAVSHATSAPDDDGVTLFQLDGRFVRLLTFPGAKFEELAIEAAGTVVVADYRKNVARRVDFAKSQITDIGTAGLESGQTNGPTGVAIDCRGNLYVLDGAARFDGAEGGPRGGSKLLKYAVSAEPPPCGPPPAPPAGGPAPATPPALGLGSGPAVEGTQVNDVEVIQAVQPPLTYTAGPVLAEGQVAFAVPELKPRSRAWGQTTRGAASGELAPKARLKTVVRVFANLTGGPSGGLGNIPATLEAFTAGGERLGELQPVGRPALLLVGERTVRPALRANPNAAYTFELPDGWTTRGTLNLTARVNPAGLGCAGDCPNRSTFRLTGVPFAIIRVAPIAPIALTEGGRRPVSDPTRAFGLPQAVTPLLLKVAGWQADVEAQDLLRSDKITVEDCFIGIFPCSEDTYDAGQPEFRAILQGRLMDRIERAAEDRDIDRCDRVVFALARLDGPLPGAMRGELLARGLLPCAIGYANLQRPLTTIAHELQHAFGRPHAGRACPGTSEDDDQAGESWPPDQRGLFDGIGLNTARRSKGGRGPFDVYFPGAPPNPAAMFDLMSYCGNESNVWVSPRNWARLSNWRVNAARIAVARGRAAAATARGSGITATTTQAGDKRLRVTAVELDSGALAIAGVSPTREAGEPVDPASPYVLEALDANGAVLAGVPAAAARIAEGGVQITGTVPAPARTAQVYLRRGERATRRVATPNAPRVRIMTPRAGQRVARGDVEVRWRATDADGGPLIASVDFSTDRGRSWRGIRVGPSDNRVALSRAMLAGSRRARVRVRVDDGFNETAATSRTFTVVAAPPSVGITAPEGNLTIDAGSPLTLRGGATGAFGARLPGRGLQWFDGRQRLGGGASITVRDLSPGRHRIALAATQSGVTRRATRVVTVRGVRPAFLVLKAPAKVGRRTRSVRLRVASTVTATLSAGRRRFRVSPRARQITIPIKRGTAPLRLTLTLRAGGKSSRGTVTIARP